MRRADRQRRRTFAALAASVLVHGAVIGLLARYTPVFHPIWAVQRDFQVDLVPIEPLVPPVGQARQQGAAATSPPVTPRIPLRARPHTDVQTTTPYPMAPRSAAARTLPPPSPPPRPTSTPPPPARIVLPGAESLGPAFGAPNGTGGMLGAPTGSPTESDSVGAGVRGALRTSVGCDDPDYYNLSKAERAACHREFGVQAAIGSKQYVDAIGSAKVRNEYDRAREACERLNHYATPLDSDREHSAKAPGNWGLDKLKC